MRTNAKPSQEIRTKAAELLESQGWAHGKSLGSKGEICLVIALVRSGDRSGAVEVELKRELGESSLVNWQDRSGRTKEEVLALLRGARQ